jgi:RNA polymerase subunit RPABC4/transcription elongation factor Spt4
MPTFKHPCPHCGKFIQRDVAACPFCGTRDPFAPQRCPNCSAVIEDRSWVSCPKCGQALTPPAAASAASGAGQPSAEAPSTQSSSAAPPSATGSSSGAPATRRCTGCGAPLPEGARFCTVCGTLAD